MSQINNLLNDASNSYNENLAKTRSLVGKWNKTGLLEGINQEYDKSGMAVLLENQARQLIDENSKTGVASNTEEWSGVALPLVRRIFSEIAAKDFVSVQPMNLPSGLVFFLDFKYGTALGSGQFNQGSDIFGNTSSSGDAKGGLYETDLGLGKTSKMGYSISQSLVEDATATVADTSSVTVRNAIWRDLGYAADLSESVAAAQVGRIVVAKGQFTNPDMESVKGWAFTSASGTGLVGGSTLNADNQLSAYNYVDGTNVVMFITQSAGQTITANKNQIYYFKGDNVDTARGDFEDTTGNDNTTDIGIPEIDVELRSEAIVAKTRKLKAVWSPEFAQDLNAYHSIDAEAELTSMLSEYISMEIDLEILDMLITNALTTEYWSATIGETFNSTTSTWTAASGAEAYQQGTWFQTLGTKMQKLSNQIHAKTLRGGANFVVCGPEVATILESIPGYAADTDGTAIGKNGFAMGVQKVGALNNRFTVYKNPYMATNTILMGFRGTQFLETGAVYAPYIPLIMTPLVYDPTNFTPRKGVMTRYAKKMVRPEFYGKIFVKDLNVV
jgi:hypothetical protein